MIALYAQQRFDTRAHGPAIAVHEGENVVNLFVFGLSDSVGPLLKHARARRRRLHRLAECPEERLELFVGDRCGQVVVLAEFLNYRVEELFPGDPDGGREEGGGGHGGGSGGGGRGDTTRSCRTIVVAATGGAVADRRRVETPHEAEEPHRRDLS